MTKNQVKKEVSEEKTKEGETRDKDGRAMGCFTVSVLLFIFGMFMINSFFEWFFT